MSVVLSLFFYFNNLCLEFIASNRRNRFGVHVYYPTAIINIIIGIKIP